MVRLMGSYNRLDTAAKIRLVIFALIMLWGVFLSVYFSRVIFEIRFGDRLINVSDINDIDAGGFDLTWVARFFSRSIDVGASFIMVIIYAALVLLLTMIPMFIFRIVALKRSVETYPEEADLGKKIMLIAFILVAFLSFLVTEGTVYLPMLVFSLMWYSSGFLCYILQIKGQTLDG